MGNDILFSQVNGLQGIGKGKNPICQPTGTTAEISAGGQPPEHMFMLRLEASGVMSTF